jgi:hypothetical protein
MMACLLRFPGSISCLHFYWVFSFLLFDCPHPTYLYVGIGATKKLCWHLFNQIGIFLEGRVETESLYVAQVYILLPPFTAWQPSLVLTLSSWQAGACNLAQRRGYEVIQAL